MSFFFNPRQSVMKSKKAMCCGQILQRSVDWFQTTLYTRVPINIKKQIKRNHLEVHVPSSIFDQKNSAHYTQHPFNCAVGWRKSHFLRRNVHCPFVSFVLVRFQPKKQLYLVRALIFWFHLGTHLSKTGEEFLHYYFYHEEATFTSMYILNFY